MTPDSSPADLPDAGPPGRRNVCNCFQVTYDDVQKMLRETNGASMETLKKYYQVGTRCTSCEYEIKDLITVYHEEQRQGELVLGGVGVPLGRRIGTAYRRIKLDVLRRLIARRYGIFVLRREDMESSLVLSNMQFPEDCTNANGPAISFRVVLFDRAGQNVARSRTLKLGNNESREFWLVDLFPGLKGNLTGMLFIDYGVLTQVGSLRPYCCLNFRRMNGEFQGRWHYHDKFRTEPYNGYYHCNHPLVIGQVCYLAASNPIDQPYRSRVFMRTTDGRERETTIEIPPYGSLWRSVTELFPEIPDDHGESNALLWFENNQALMVWFFWHKQNDDIWLVQHH